jgi:chemotaxis protein MotA
MNPLSVVSFLLAGGVLAFAILTAGNPRIFLDMHAVLIVLGGTTAASAIAFQIDRILVLFRVFVRRVLHGRKQDWSGLIRDLMQIADAYRSNPAQFEKLVAQHADHFLRESMSAIQDNVLGPDDLTRVLRLRTSTLFHRHMEEVTKFKTIGKYPPAFGLMGTTLSMITLLQRLGEPGGQKLIGPAMALGLVATFYGLALSNLVFGPMAESLADNARETKLKNTIIVEGVRLIMAKTNPIVLAEELNSFLMPSERIDWKTLQGRGNAAAPGEARAA